MDKLNLIPFLPYLLFPLTLPHRMSEKRRGKEKGKEWQMLDNQSTDTFFQHLIGQICSPNRHMAFECSYRRDSLLTWKKMVCHHAIDPIFFAWVTANHGLRWWG